METAGTTATAREVVAEMEARAAKHRAAGDPARAKRAQDIAAHLRAKYGIGVDANA
jgi:hypothetical protein